MKSRVFNFSLAVAGLFLSVTYGYAQKAGKAPKDKVLANKVFTVETAETTGKKVGKKAADEVSFKSNKFSSKFITTETKFPAGPYTVEVDSSSTPHDVTFISEGKNTEGEDMKIEGVVTGDEIEGTAVISKKGKVKREFSFTGTLKEKKGAKK